MYAHVKHVVRVCYGKLREISSLRKFITKSVAKTLVQAVIISHLDYGNSMLYGISKHLLDKLQRVQNAAARLVLGYKKHDHITPGLIRLHWLPVRYRIQYKIATITYNVLSTNQPGYLRDLLHLQQPTRTRRSEQGMILRVPRSNLKSAGYRSFSVCAPKISNSLPVTVTKAQSVSVFKKNLKTFYFRSAYGHLLEELKQLFIHITS